jgi:hypothetical protein
VKRAIFLVLIALSVWGIVVLQKHLTNLQDDAWKQENLTYLPSSDAIKPFLLGFESTYAEYLWIRTVIYFGSHYLTDRHYDYLIKMIDNITRLNPYFFPAYEFAGLMIPEVCSNPQAARSILERGMSYLGTTRWNIPFYMGVLYYRYFSDRKTAGYYYSLAARVPGAPKRQLADIAAGMMVKAGEKKQALDFLSFLSQTTDNPQIRDFISSKINELNRTNK